MFLLIMSISYFFQLQIKAGQQAVAAAPPRSPVLRREFGFEVPQGYWFHPGHMWAFREGQDVARVEIDQFATNLVGNIDRVEVCCTNRWVGRDRSLCPSPATARRSNCSLQSKEWSRHSTATPCTTRSWSRKIPTKMAGSP